MIYMAKLEDLDHEQLITKYKRSKKTIQVLCEIVNSALKLVETQNEKIAQLKEMISNINKAFESR